MVPLAEVERRHVERVLHATGWNKARAARVLGVDIKTLNKKIRDFMIAQRTSREKLLPQGEPPGPRRFVAGFVAGSTPVIPIGYTTTPGTCVAQASRCHEDSRSPRS